VTWEASDTIGVVLALEVLATLGIPDIDVLRLTVDTPDVEVPRDTPFTALPPLEVMPFNQGASCQILVVIRGGAMFGEARFGPPILHGELPPSMLLFALVPDLTFTYIFIFKFVPALLLPAALALFTAALVAAAPCPAANMPSTLNAVLLWKNAFDSSGSSYIIAVATPCITVAMPLDATPTTPTT